MVVTCPHCHANYKLATTIRNAMLVCHRCGEEFSLDQQEQKQESASKPDMPSLFDWKRPPDDMPPSGKASAPAADAAGDEIFSDEDNELPHFLLKEHHLVSSTTTATKNAKVPERAPRPDTGQPRSEPAKAIDEASQAISPGEQAMLDAAAAPTAGGNEQPADSPILESSSPAVEMPETAMVPPARRKTRIWPWLIFILLSTATAGAWFKKELWLQDPWVRSTLLNLNLPLALRSSDWHITPESVHSQWLTRDDKSRILIIEGKVENQLFSELPPPSIRVQLFDLPGARKPVSTQIIPVTEPPSMSTLKKAPYDVPPWDRLPIAGGGTRAFVLVVERLPEDIRDFALTPLPPQ